MSTKKTILSSITDSKFWQIDGTYQIGTASSTNTTSTKAQGWLKIQTGKNNEIIIHQLQQPDISHGTIIHSIYTLAKKNIVNIQVFPLPLPSKNCPFNLHARCSSENNEIKVIWESTILETTSASELKLKKIKTDVFRMLLTTSSKSKTKRIFN